MAIVCVPAALDREECQAVTAADDLETSHRSPGLDAFWEVEGRAGRLALSIDRLEIWRQGIEPRALGSRHDARLLAWLSCLDLVWQTSHRSELGNAQVLHVICGD